MSVPKPDESEVSTLDLGRHRLYAAKALSDDGERSIVPLGDGHDGFFLRWFGENGTERFVDRIQTVAGVDDDAALDLVSELGTVLADRLPPTRRLIVGVPPSFGRCGREAVIDGFARAGLKVAPTDVVDRPLAALAGWFAHRVELSGHPPTDPVLLIDNDGGALSAAVADPRTERLLVSTPISAGANDTPDAVEEHLRYVLRRANALTHQGGIIAADDWASVSATIGQVVVTGSGSQHPWLVGLLRRLMPAADVMPDPITPAEQCVAIGLAHLDQFMDWTACWPTLTITAGTSVVRSSGPVAGPGPESILVPRRAVLGLEQHGQQVPVLAGTVNGSGIALPGSLGSMPVLRVLDDGRLIALGPQGVPPLSIQVEWPSPGAQVDSVTVNSVGRRALTLVTEPATTPTDDRPHRATGGS